MRISRPRTRGFTLLEIVVASGITVIIMTMVLSTFNFSDDTMNEAIIQTNLDMQASAIVERMANDIKDAQASSIKVGVAGGFTANDGISFTKADSGNLQQTATPPYYGFTPGTAVTYSCVEYPQNGLTLDGRPNVANSLVRQETPVGGASRTEVLTSQLSGDPSNEYPALSGEQESISGGYVVNPPTSTIRIPINPKPDPSDPHPDCPRAVYITSSTYSSGAASPITYVDIYVIVAQLNYRRYLKYGQNVSNSGSFSADTNYLENAYLYTQLGYAHTRVKVNNP